MVSYDLKGSNGAEPNRNYSPKSSYSVKSSILSWNFGCRKRYLHLIRGNILNEK